MTLPIAAILALLIALLAALPPFSARDEKKLYLSSLNEGWYYLQDNEKIPLQLPATLHYAGEEALVIYNDSLGQDTAGQTLTTKGIEQGLTALMNGQVLYVYSDDAFPRNAQMKSKYECDIPIPANMEVGTLEIHFEKVNSGLYKISSFYMGNGIAVMWHHFMNNALPIILAFSFFTLGVIALGISFYLHYSRIDKKRFIDTAIFLLICSIWVFTDSPITQVQSGNASAICTISFYAFMLLAVPMLYFIKHTEGMDKYPLLDWLIGLFCLNALVQGVLHLTLGTHFKDMLFVTHLLLTVGVGISILLLTKEYKKAKNYDVKMTLLAFSLLASSGILAIALYWFLNIPYYGMIFEIGISLFVIILIKLILTIMVENMQYRSEMQVYQRLLRADGMTGMESRQPFDDFLTVIQRSPSQYQNAALIFFKLTQLKSVNEESGRAAGDELILGAAKCISETFGSSGRCYRLKSDEFGVILEDALFSQEEWFQRFDLAVQKFNRNSQYRLSISKGWSDFSNEDGSLKTISNWKFSANQNLQ